MKSDPSVKLRQLNDIKFAATALDRGGSSPRARAAFGAGLVAAIIASGIFELDPAVVAGTGLGTLFLVYKFAPLSKSWYDVLDSRLAAYEPVDEAAYAFLHKTTRADDGLKLSAVFRWLSHEYDAVQSCLPRRTAEAAVRFVSKDVPVRHIGALAESNAARRELTAGQFKQVDLMADANAVEHERRRAVRFYQLALEYPDKTASELAALLEAELPRDSFAERLKR